MPIHSHLSQKDPQKVIKEVKKAIENGEGCQVIKIFGLFLSFSCLSHILSVAFYISYSYSDCLV